MLLSTRHFALLAIVFPMIVIAGCSQSADSDGPSEMDQLARMLDKPKEEAKPQAPSESAPSRPVEPEPTPPVVAAPTQPPSETETAEEQPEEQSGGYLSSIAMAHRSIRTRVDDLAWKQAVSHYKATNGRMPRSHEEFMTGVIEAFRIPLPELEPDEKYLYEPDEGQFGELYVVRERQQ